MPQRPSRAKPWPAAANALRLDGIAAGTSAAGQMAEARKHIAHGQHLLAIVAISDAESSIRQLVHSLTLAGSALQEDTQ